MSGADRRRRDLWVARLLAPLLAAAWVFGLLWLMREAPPGKSSVGVLLFYIALSFVGLAFVQRRRARGPRRTRRKRRVREGAPPPPSPIRLKHSRPAVGVSSTLDQLVQSAVLLLPVGGLYVLLLYRVVFGHTQERPWLRLGLLLLFVVVPPALVSWRRRRRSLR